MTPNNRERERAAAFFSENEPREKAADMLCAHREYILRELAKLHMSQHPDADAARDWNQRAIAHFIERVRRGLP